MSDAITHSVGLGGRNHRHDVLTVQILLNNHGISAWGGHKLDVDGVCGPHTVGAIKAYQERQMHMAHADGVIYPTGNTLRRLLEVASVKHVAVVQQVHKIQKMQAHGQGPVPNVDQVAPKPSFARTVAGGTPPPASGHKYTDSPLELIKTRTLVDPKLLPDLLKKAWPELTNAGARLITAQYMGETTGGKSCWNYNLGNVKATNEYRKKNTHQYLGGTWEYWDKDKAAKEVATDPNARYATAAEIKQKVGKEKDGKQVVFYKPPDIQCCFRAYKTLSDAIDDWTAHYKRTVARNPGLLAEMNKGDAKPFIAALVKEHYFTNSSSSYLSSVAANQKYLDSALGGK